MKSSQILDPLLTVNCLKKGFGLRSLLYYFIIELNKAQITSFLP